MLRSHQMGKSVSGPLNSVYEPLEVFDARVLKRVSDFSSQAHVHLHVCRFKGGCSHLPCTGRNEIQSNLHLFSA